jgi:hypothetical protein
MWWWWWCHINLSVVMYDDALVVASLHISETANWRDCVLPDFTIRGVAQKVMLLLSLSLSAPPPQCEVVKMSDR